MPDGPVILDSGPLVAFLVDDDVHHAWAVERFSGLRPPLLTCEPVLVETFHLVRRFRSGPRRFFDMLRGDGISIPYRFMEDRDGVENLVQKYADVPMSLADACIVRMAEMNPHATVVTTDRDFRVYRRHGREPIPVSMPRNDK